jgi:hypothetical protein
VVTGDQDWSTMFDGMDVPQHERNEYQRGISHGAALLDAERYADGWQECYTLAAVETARAAESLPVCNDDCPF